MKWFLYALLLYFRDIAAMPRQPWFHHRRFLLTVASTFLLTMSLAVMEGNSVAPGLTLYRYLLIGLVLSAFMMAIWAGGSVLIREREERTLDLLLLSELCWGQLIFAKFLYTFTFVLLLLASALPVIAICYGLGGVGPHILMLSLAVVVAVTLLGSALGICIAATARNMPQIHVWSAAIGAFIFLIVPSTVAAILSMISISSDKWLIVVSPLQAALAVAAGTSGPHLELHVATMLAATLAALFLARLLLPRSLVYLRRPGIVARLGDDLRSTQTMQRLTMKPDIQGNPLGWLDLYSAFGGYRLGILKMLFFSVVLAAMILLFSSIAALDLRDAALMVWRFLTLFYCSVIVAGTVSRCSMAFSREQHSGAMDILMTSDLSNRELLEGKAIGILMAYMPYLVALAACLMTAVTFLDTIEKQINLLLTTVELVGVWFACCSTAFFLSVKYGHSNSITGACILYFMIWTLIVLIFPINGVLAHLLFALIAALWHGYIGLLCWRFLARQCRDLLLHNPSIAVESP